MRHKVVWFIMAKLDSWKEKFRDLQRRFEIEQEEDVGLYAAVACTSGPHNDPTGAMRARLEKELDCMCIVCPELKIIADKYIAEEAAGNRVWEWAFLGRKEDFDLFCALARQAVQLVDQLPTEVTDTFPPEYLNARIDTNDFRRWLSLLFTLAWQCRTVSLLRAERTKINNPSEDFISVLPLDLFRASALALDMLCKNK